MNKILLFAGTTEGRHMAEFLNRHRLSAVVCAATEYGKCQILPGEYLDVRSERLNADEMVRLIQEEQICLVIDATHPYAVLVSKTSETPVNRRKQNICACFVLPGRSERTVSSLILWRMRWNG